MSVPPAIAVLNREALRRRMGKYKKIIGQWKINGIDREQQ